MPAVAQPLLAALLILTSRTCSRREIPGQDRNPGGAVGKRDDFTTRFITRGTSGGTPMAAIDWDAAITALNSSDLPCSGGERRILLLSASLAAGTPVSLRDTVTGLDHDNTTRLLTAIRHATGKRPGNDRCR